MRKSFKFSAEILEAGKNIPDKELRLKFYEAILELGINDIQLQEEDPLLKALLAVPTAQILKANWISTLRSSAWSWGAEAKSKAQKGNNNAKKTRTKSKKTKKSDPIEEAVEMIPVEESSQDPLVPQDPDPPKKGKNQKKRDENIELIDSIKAKVESLWLVYRSWKDERNSATNIRTGKQFGQTAEKFWLTPKELALAVIEASMSDKFWSWKINNCETIYYNYAKIINQVMANNQKIVQATATLPWA